MAKVSDTYLCRCGHTNHQHEWIEYMPDQSRILVWGNVCKEDCPCDQFDPEDIYLGGAPG